MKPQVSHGVALAPPVPAVRLAAFANEPFETWASSLVFVIASSVANHRAPTFRKFVTELCDNTFVLRKRDKERVTTRTCSFKRNVEISQRNAHVLRGTRMAEHSAGRVSLHPCFPQRLWTASPENTGEGGTPALFVSKEKRRQR